MFLMPSLPSDTVDTPDKCKVDTPGATVRVELPDDSTLPFADTRGDIAESDAVELVPWLGCESPPLCEESTKCDGT